MKKANRDHDCKVIAHRTERGENWKWTVNNIDLERNFKDKKNVEKTDQGPNCKVNLQDPSYNYPVRQ